MWCISRQVNSLRRVRTNTRICRQSEREPERDDISSMTAIRLFISSSSVRTKEELTREAGGLNVLARDAEFAQLGIERRTLQT